MLYNKKASKSDNRGGEPKGLRRGKSGLPRAGIVGNAHRRRLQSQCNRDIPPVFFIWARVERRGKSSPAGRGLSGHVNLIPEQHRTEENRSARPASQRWLKRFGNETLRQMIVEYRTRLTDLLENFTIKTRWDIYWPTAFFIKLFVVFAI